MPELPEVETTLRGISPHILNTVLTHVDVRQKQLRWPVSTEIETLAGSTITHASRRGKYLLLRLQADKPASAGTLILHLGMSGSLRICQGDAPLRKHDHIEFLFAGGQALRFHDPRRFGCALWCRGTPETHPLLAQLGPEPLSDEFNGEYLFQQSRKRKVNIKNFIMNSHTVVGVGNIYASESLFKSGLRPGRAAMRVSREGYEQLSVNIKEVLAKAIKMGGTTLRDFINSDGEPGYFSQQLLVYGRAGEPCHSCGTTIKNKIIGQRSSYYCPRCQQ